MPKLYVRCKTCRREFFSGMSSDEESFKTLTLIGMTHICPNGHANLYNKEDYFFLSTVERKSRPIKSEEQRDCEHTFVDITEERRGTDSPYLYFKCKICGLVTIKDRFK